MTGSDRTTWAERIKEAAKTKNIGDLRGKATKFYFTNFPEIWDEGGLSKSFGLYGKVIDVYVAKKKNRWGKLFGFVSFIGVEDRWELEKQLNGIWIGSFKLRANIAKYNRMESRKDADSEEKRFKVEQPKAAGKLIKTTLTNDRLSFAEIVRSGTMGHAQEGDNNGAQDADESPRSNVPAVIITSGDENKERCRRSLIGKLRNVDLLRKISNFNVIEGFNDVRLYYIGGLHVQLEFNMREAATVFMNEEIDTWRRWFESLVAWNPQFTIDSRLTTIVVYGIPVQALCSQTLIEIGSIWGEVLFTQGGDTDDVTKNKGVIGVILPLNEYIKESVMIMVDDKEYVIRVIEDEGCLKDWLPVKKKVDDDSQQDSNGERWEENFDEGRKEYESHGGQDGEEEVEKNKDVVDSVPTEKNGKRDPMIMGNHEGEMQGYENTVERENNGPTKKMGTDAAEASAILTVRNACDSERASGDQVGVHEAGSVKLLFNTTPANISHDMTLESKMELWNNNKLSNDSGSGGVMSGGSSKQLFITSPTTPIIISNTDITLETEMDLTKIKTKNNKLSNNRDSGGAPATSGGPKQTNEINLAELDCLLAGGGFIAENTQLTATPTTEEAGSSKVDVGVHGFIREQETDSDIGSDVCGSCGGYLEYEEETDSDSGSEVCGCCGGYSENNVVSSDDEAEAIIDGSTKKGLVLEEGLDNSDDNFLEDSSRKINRNKKQRDFKMKKFVAIQCDCKNKKIGVKCYHEANSGNVENDVFLAQREDDSSGSESYIAKANSRLRG